MEEEEEARSAPGRGDITWAEEVPRVSEYSSSRSSDKQPQPQPQRYQQHQHHHHQVTPHYRRRSRSTEKMNDTEEVIWRRYNRKEPARSREGQRRRTAVVTYDPNQAGQTLEYDDLGTMSDLELPSFQRGGFMRTSLPIVRSASTSLEKPLGLVFLVYGDQTKKSLLPNEITTLDTVRALFVRAFPDLTLDMLEKPRKKIYILDPATNIYFQLEDLAEIKDRSVLKIHETDNDQPQRVKERQEVRGRTVQMPTSRPQSRQGYLDAEGFSKSQSLPPQAYPEMMQEQRNQWEMERRSRSRTPEPAERPRSLSAGASASTRQRFSHSPDRLPTPERGPLNPIPENRQLTPGYGDQHQPPVPYYDGGHRGQYPAALYESPAHYQSYPAPSPALGAPAYMARSTRAAPMAHPQRAVAPGAPGDPNVRGSNSNRHSLAFAPMSMAQVPPQEGNFQRAPGYRIPPTERDGVELAHSHSVTSAGDPNTRNRIEKMEAQLADLTAWVHYQKTDTTRREVTPPPRSLGSTSDSSETFPASSASKHKGDNPPISTFATTNRVVPSQGLSDIPDGLHHPHRIRSSGESTPIAGHADVTMKLAQLKSDLHILRRQQQLNMEAMREEFVMAFSKMKKIFSTVPDADAQVNVHKRSEAVMTRKAFTTDKEQVDKELSDLEASVEELRTDVISRQCRVNLVDVEGMALLLSNITKSLADLKARFPDIHKQMKDVMDCEMQIVVSEEKFLKEEPGEIETSLKRCKKLTGTLYTLKRLASVQDHRPPQVPNMVTSDEPISNQKNIVLENIRAMIPDHEHRLQQMEAADASRERKKKINSQQDALKFGKCVEMVSRNLRPPSMTDDDLESVGVSVESVGTSQPSRIKPTVPAKPVNMPAASSSFPYSSSSSSSSSAPLTSTVTTHNMASTKPSSFSAALTTTAKPSSDKPTATVLAMTIANTPTSDTASKASMPELIRAVSLPLSENTARLTNTIHSGTGPVTHTVKLATEPCEKAETIVPSSHMVMPTSPVKPPVFTKPPSLLTSPSSKLAHPEVIENKESSKPSDSDTVQMRKDVNRPTDVPILQKSKSTALSSTSMPPTSPPAVKPVVKPVSWAGSSNSTVKNTVNGHTEELSSPDKVMPLASQKQAARSAFFSSMSTPPTSPSLPTSNRNSAQLDPGPIISPGPAPSTGSGSELLGKVTPGPTINLVLSGVVSPSSSTSPGNFTITPPRDIISPPPIVEEKKQFPSAFPATSGCGVSDTKTPASSVDSEHGTNSHSDAVNKQRKVPPPPPPRKGSRPTSGSMSPVNGLPLSPTHQPSQEAPRFVGGVLGQHRLYSGPMSSTPKSEALQSPKSKFEKDIASGIYANLNRPDLQSQKSSPQQILGEIKTSNAVTTESDKDTSSKQPHARKADDELPIPPPPSITMGLDREERGSSSESTSSSSGTSMGSQQSVVSVVRSASVTGQSSKAKPDPPKRHSSLLSKFTGVRDSKNKINNGKAKVNGVDL